jgi:hypothetical protein
MRVDFWKIDAPNFSRTEHDADMGGATPLDLGWVVTDTTALRVQFVVGLLGLLALAYEAWRGRRGLPEPGRALWGALAALGVAAFFNLGLLPFGGYQHPWEQFHHDVGTRYFAELGYDGLYACATLAETELPGAPPMLADRPVRDLRTDRLVPASTLLAEPPPCRARFTDARWTSFREAVGFHRQRLAPPRWAALFRDRGLNATPAWLAVVGPLLGDAHPTAAHLGALTLIDPLLFLGAVACLLWGFGLRTTALVLVALASNAAARMVWTGGSIVRWEWFLGLTAGVALLRRDRPLSAGLVLGAGALLRLLPGFALLAPLLVFALQRTAAARRVLLGAALAVGVGFLATASSSPGGVWAEWREWGADLATHLSVPSPHRVGMKTLLSWRPDESMGALRRPDAPGGPDPEAAWVAARTEAFADARFVYLTGVSLALLLLARAVRRAPLWAGALLSLALIPARARAGRLLPDVRRTLDVSLGPATRDRARGARRDEPHGGVGAVGAGGAGPARRGFRRGLRPALWLAVVAFRAWAGGREAVRASRSCGR